MKIEFQIEGRWIGEKHPPFIIAEMSGNHNQSIERAISIIDAAALSGAHAIKLQTYTADTITINGSQDEFYIRDQNSQWNGKSLYELYSDAYTPWEWHETLFKHAKEKNIICFSTPFDETAVDFLENMNVPAYKIASFESNYLLLLKKVAKTGKPVLISTGLSTLSELDEAVRTLRENGCNELVLLKCTSTYPAKPSESNILTIPHMAKLFACQVGLSDHTLGTGVATASVALGARVIEKHLTISRSDGGVDSAFSLEPDEFRTLVNNCLDAYYSLGEIKYDVNDNEWKNRIFKRSIYIIKDMKAGEFFNTSNLKIIRPGQGISPKYFDIVLGKKVNCDVKRGTALTFELIG